MNRFDISLFGFRLIARGYAGIAGALLVVAMLIGLAVVSSLVELLADGLTVLPTDHSSGAVAAAAKGLSPAVDEQASLEASPVIRVPSSSDLDQRGVLASASED